MRQRSAYSFSKAFQLGVLILTGVSWTAFAQPYYVAPSGNDANSGTLSRPFATLDRAQKAARLRPGSVFLRQGTYYLREPLVFTSEEFG